MISARRQGFPAWSATLPEGEPVRGNPEGFLSRNKTRPQCRDGCRLERIKNSLCSLYGGDDNPSIVGGSVILQMTEEKPDSYRENFRGTSRRSTGPTYNKSGGLCPPLISFQSRLLFHRFDGCIHFSLQLHFSVSNAFLFLIVLFVFTDFQGELRFCIESRVHLHHQT